jgi:predicted transcriptional regulator
MEHKRLTYGEARLMQLIWDGEPLASGALTDKCLQELGWKKSTSYTMLKKLIEKGYVKNENAVVTARIPRAAAQAEESRDVVERSFSGSLPSFLVSFLGGKTISDAEAEELKALIDAHRER